MVSCADSPAERASNSGIFKLKMAVEECNQATRDKLGVVLCLPARMKKALAKAAKKAQLKPDSAVEVGPFLDLSLLGKTALAALTR